MVNLTILKGFKIRIDINIETGVMDENKFNDVITKILLHCYIQICLMIKILLM